MKNLVKSSVAALIISLVLCGCTSTYRSPDLPVGGAEKIATVEPKDYAAGNLFFVFRIDSKPLGFGLFSKYELTPGRHSITATVNRMRGYSSEPVTRYFTARAGVRYQLIYKAYQVNENDKDMLWNFVIIDTETGENVESEQE